MKILILILIVFLSSCSAENPEKMVHQIVEDYYESLVKQDLDKQLEILEPFSLDREMYWESFLSYVEKGELLSIETHYEDELLIMVELDFILYLKEDFPENPSFSPGENRVQRYFGFFKKEDYKLKEILNKAIY